jgi:hypothetical protein
MVQGYIIAEGIRLGSWLGKLNLRLVNIERVQTQNAGPDQPKVWTLIHFESPEDPGRLASALSEALDDNPSRWYTDFETDSEKFVIFPKRVFRYPIGNRARLEEARAYARSIGIPQSQVDFEG